MGSKIITNFLKFFRPKYQYTCYLCYPQVKLKNLKHLKFHNKKYHKNKIGIIYNR